MSDFKPACGTVNPDGTITVSGMNFTQQEIDLPNDVNLVEIFRQIKNRQRET